jgi:polysaccharide biosynthesis/export protein
LLVDPQVTVFLVESRSQQVSVLGAVRSPGRYGVESNSTVLDVLAQAGGIADHGGTTVVVMRPDSTGQLTRHVTDLQGLGDNERALPLLTLRGGDSVFVPAAEQFSIYGEVGAPNIYRLDPGMTVVEAITRGGGVTPRGSRSRVEIRRAKADGSFETRSAALDDRVEANDVIRVKERLF